jgi:hypothetical protein
MKNGVSRIIEKLNEEALDKHTFLRNKILSPVVDLLKGTQVPKLVDVTKTTLETLASSIDLGVTSGHMTKDDGGKLKVLATKLQSDLNTYQETLQKLISKGNDLVYKK